MSDLTSATAPLILSDDYLGQNNTKKYSLTRLLKNILYPDREKHSWTIETEISEDLKLKSSGPLSGNDYLIPPAAIGIRNLSTLNTGSALIDNTQSELFNFFPEPKSQVLSAGVRVVTGLQDRYEIYGTSEPFTAYFVEEQSPIPQTSPSARKILLKPHKIAALCTLSLEMLNQTPLFAEQYIAEGLNRALFRKIDETVFAGNGIDQPLGILFHPDVDSIVLGENGGLLDLSAVVEMEKRVTDNNPQADNHLAYFVDSPTAGALKRTEKIGGSGQFIMTDQPLAPLDEIKQLNSRRAIVTNNLPKNLIKGSSNDLSMAVFGDWSQVVIGFFGAISLTANRYGQGNFDRGLVTVRLIALVDIAVLNPRLFCVASDIKTTNSNN